MVSRGKEPVETMGPTCDRITFHIVLHELSFLNSENKEWQANLGAGFR